MKRIVRLCVAARTIPLDFFGTGNYNVFMKYVELTLHTTTEASELVADAMWEFTPHGVAVCDVNDIVALQKDSTVFWDYMDDELTAAPQRDVLVKCFFEPELAEDAIRGVLAQINARKELAGEEIPFGTLEDTKREIEGDDWIDVWKKHFRPLHVGERIVVVPEWIGYERNADEVIVTLDSNMAFGTGEHETTAMCLEFLQEYLRAGDVCIDVGCGSGILGIAAAKLGAKQCYLTDVDPIAVESAKHNAQKNGVSQNIVVAHSNLLDEAKIKGEIVLANITAEVLVMLAPAIPEYLKKDGTLILSGIIQDRLPKVREAFERTGLKEHACRGRGEWYALVYGWNE